MFQSDIDFSKIAGLLEYQPDAPMIFNSGIFLYLFLGFSLVYMLLSRKDTLRILFVTLFSYYFYYKSSGTYFFLLFIVTFTDFCLARGMGQFRAKWIRKMLVAVSLAVNLGLLVYFKYTNFFGEIIASVRGGTFEPLDIFLPVGISFFTFQSLSYTIDVYRGNIKPLDRLLDYAFYVSFFPQLVAGPIVRARDFIPQIRKPLTVTREMFGTGIFYIICGLIKKAVISDYISVNFVERIFDNPSLYSGVENLAGVYGYALQIYCDFSGYSDMAIGIALLLGFRFPENFNSPYISASVTEFWHRWHISLSTWLRDYLYISLGGNRKGKVRTYVNLFITMLLGGLWHGANWTFVLWGVLHAAYRIIGELTSESRKALWKKMNINTSRLWFRSGQRAITFLLVCFSWIFFRANSLSDIGVLLSNLASGWGQAANAFSSMGLGISAALVALLSIIIMFQLDALADRNESSAGAAICTKNSTVWLVWAVAVAWIMLLSVGGASTFIYFQF